MTVSLTRRALAAVVLMVTACDPSAAKTLGQQIYLGRTLDEWFVQAGDKDVFVALDARAAFRKLGPEAVPYLAAKLKDRNAEVRDRAGGVLKSLCGDALPLMQEELQRRESIELAFAIDMVENSRKAMEGTTPCGEGRP